MPTIQEMIETSKQKLGAIGGIVGDFARGVGATADIPKTIVTGTQTSYGANIPTVEDTRQKLVESTPSAGGIIKDAATGVSRIFNNVNTPTANLGATPPAVAPTVASTPPSAPINAVSRPEGDPNFFKGGATLQPSTGLGASPSSTGMNDKDLADWKARGVKLGVVGASQIENPGISNNELYNSKNPEYVKMEEVRANPILSKINDISNNISSDPLTRKYQLLQIGALNQTLDKQNAVRGQDTLAETTRRGQDIVAETAKRAQDISAKIHGDQTLLDTFYKTGLLEQGKEELGIKKLQAEAKDLPGYLKLVTSMSPKIKTTDPVTGAETESHDVAKGVELLTQAGFATPKGFKAPGASKVPSFDEVRAVAKAKGTKMSDEQLTQYYNEKYGKGR